MDEQTKVTLPVLADLKARGERIVMVTAYDAPSARLERASSNASNCGQGRRFRQLRRRLPLTVRDPRRTAEPSGRFESLHQEASPA